MLNRQLAEELSSMDLYLLQGRILGDWGYSKLQERLVHESGEGAMKRILDMFSRFAGRELTVDEQTYQSEHETGHRNRAIGYMLRNFDIVTDSPDRGLDLYFRQCSITVTCRDLAVMAATLANRGLNPVTDERALDAQFVDSVLSVMGSCGMYNYAGEWIYRVGIPAKSGVSGGVLACLPGEDEKLGGAVADVEFLFGLHWVSPPIMVRMRSVTPFSSASISASGRGGWKT